MWRDGARPEGSLHTRKKVMAENIKTVTAGGGAAQEQRYPAQISGALEWEDSKAVYKRCGWAGWDGDGPGWGRGWDVVGVLTATTYIALCRFSELYVLVLTGLHRKEWTALKFVDEFYDCMEGQLGQVRAPCQVGSPVR